MIKSFKDMQVWLEDEIVGINIFSKRNHTGNNTKNLIFLNLNLNLNTQLQGNKL